MIIYNERDQHIVLLPVNISKDGFLSQAKVKDGSYFYKRLESVYVALTSSTVNIEEEYKKYYSEYETFRDFLYHKYPHFKNDTLDMIIEKTGSGKYILLRGYMQELADHNMQTLMTSWDYESSEFMRIIDNLLKEEIYES